MKRTEPVLRGRLNQARADWIVVVQAVAVRSLSLTPHKSSV